MLIIFIHARVWPDFPFPHIGEKLNNSLAFLIILLTLRGVFNSSFRKKQFDRLRNCFTDSRYRIYIFSILFLIEFILQVLWFADPEDFYWNLNAEQGYGTLFSSLQLYLLGLIVLLTAKAENGEDAPWSQKLPWYLVASVYFFIALDDCVGIHENFMILGRNLALESTIFHFIHEWLWFYGPVAVVVVVFFARFFLKRFIYSPRIIVTMFIALTLWICVLVLEGLSKNVVDPLGLNYGRILIAVEEGFEMFGATLFILGFSRHYKNLQEKSRTET